MEVMYDVNLDESEGSSFKSGDESFETDFVDILSESSCELKYLK